MMSHKDLDQTCALVQSWSVFAEHSLNSKVSNVSSGSKQGKSIRASCSELKLSLVNVLLKLRSQLFKASLA